MRLPVYRRGMPLATVAQRREAFTGMVSASFVVIDLMRGVISQPLLQKIHVRIHDAGFLDSPKGLQPPTAENLMFDSDRLPAAPPSPRAAGNSELAGLASTSSVDVGGRQWNVSFTARQEFGSPSDRWLPWAVFLGGISITLLLFGLIRSLATVGNRAVTLAESITEDLRASEVRLTKAQRQTQELIEVLPNPVYFKGTDGRNLGVNKAWEAYFGTQRRAYVGKTVHDLYPDNPEVAARLHADDQELWNNPGTRAYETSITTPDGKQHDVVYYKATFTHTDGSVAGLIGTIVDITERKRAARELQHKADLSQLLEALARAVNEAATPEAAMEACLARICEHGNWVLGHIAVFAPGRSAGIAAASLWHSRDPAGRYEEFISYSDGYSHNIPTGRFVGVALREKRPVWIEDLSRATGPGRSAVAFKHGLLAVLVFPVIVNGEATAFLEFFADEPRPPDAAFLEAIGTIASQLSRVIEHERGLGALREREHLMRLVTENVPAMIAYFDAELRCRFANAAFCRFHHLDPQGVTGMGLRDITGKDTYRVISPTIARVKQGEPVMLRRQERAENGEIRHIEIHRVPDMSSEGAFRGYYAMLLDITEQVRAEEANARLAAIIESSNDAIVSRSPDLTILTWNAGAERLFGWTAEEAIGRPITMLIPPEQQEEVGINTARLQAGRPLMAYDTVRLTKDGRRIEVSRTESPIKNERGEMTSVSLIFTDITERRRAEIALRDSESRYRAVIAAITEGVVLRDRDARIVACNASAERILGMTLDQMRGNAYFWPETPAIREDGSLFREDERPLHVALRTGQLQSNVVQGLRRPDGTVLWLSLNVQPLFEGSATTPSGVVSTITDITERKRAEAVRNALEAQLREAQKIEAIGTLAGGIAHDFNNILGAIIGNTVLARQDVGADHRALVSLDEIYKASQRAKDLVQQILTFGRKQQQELLSQPLHPVVENTVKLLRATLPTGVELVIKCADTSLHVHADATQIQQVLMNLCVNAWHAMEGRPGRIEIGIDAVLLDAAAVSNLSGLQPGRHVRLRVSDNGCGMDAATLARIFEPFFTTKPVDQGTGLGLSVVHGIVKSHHGAITVKSAPGAGTTFRVYFPAVATLQAEKLPAPAAPGPARGNGQHVLYVDDDEAMVFLVTRMLEGLGYRASGYERAVEALAAVRAEPEDFDLAVTDFNMPGMSGIEVAQELARISPELPVVITSGYITEELRANALQAGVRHLVYKPNTVDELCEVIQRLLETADA